MGGLARSEEESAVPPTVVPEPASEPSAMLSPAPEPAQAVAPDEPAPPTSAQVPTEPPPTLAWSPVLAEGREYVRAAEVAAFYHFDRVESEGWTTHFRSPTMVMRWETESPYLTLNGTRIMMEWPCQRRGEDVLISRLDLVKCLDPLLRPAHIAGTEVFDTVVIDPGHGGLDNGTRGLLGEEKAYALNLGLRLRDALQKKGFRTVMTRARAQRPAR
jgi:hypothetical protein